MPATTTTAAPPAIRAVRLFCGRFLDFRRLGPAWDGMRLGSSRSTI
jgi:hypothetical protein